MKNETYLSIVRASAIYDLVVTFPFAFPILALFNITFLTDIHENYLFSGTFPEFLPIHLLFVNFMGCLVIVWSVLRMSKPYAFLGLYDSYARFLFSFTMLYYLLVHDVTGILWLFFIPELTWGSIQFFGYYYRDNEST